MKHVVPLGEKLVMLCHVSDIAKDFHISTKFVFETLPINCGSNFILRHLPADCQ